MTKFEAVEAYRPLESTELVSEMERESKAKFGPRGLNFHAAELLEHGAVLLDLTHVASAHEEAGVLDNMPPGGLAELEEMNLPGSFLRGARITLKGYLKLVTARRPKTCRRMLVAPAEMKKPVNGEVSSLLSTLDRVAGKTLARRSTEIKLRLATVHTHNIGSKDLEELAEYMPHDVYTHSGIISPVDLETQETESI